MIKSRRMRWAGHVARMGAKRTAYRIVMVKQEGNRPLGRPRHTWVDNIKMVLRVIGWTGLMSQDRNHWRPFENTVMNLRVP
jgi:hypothetical protein